MDTKEGLNIALAVKRIVLGNKKTATVEDMNTIASINKIIKAAIKIERLMKRLECQKLKQ